MAFILGLKKNTLQIFDEEGIAMPATLIEAGPVIVSQLRTKERDGYKAVQVGFGAKKHLNKPQRSQYKDLGSFRHIKEFRVSETDKADFNLGDKITVEAFKEGDKVDISGTVKGRGFQGVVKRHGFHGGPRTHGQKHSEREPGSISGGGGRPGGRVAKGMRMAGRMGGNRITVKNLKILQIDPKNNFFIISGAVPGARGALLEIRTKSLATGEVIVR